MSKDFETMEQLAEYIGAPVEDNSALVDLWGQLGDGTITDQQIIAVVSAAYPAKN